MCGKMMAGKCTGSKIGWCLVIVGALNWGLVGLGKFIGGDNWNVVNLVFGNWMWLENLIYVLVGLAGVMSLVGCRCKVCKGEGGCCKSDGKCEEKK